MDAAKLAARVDEALSPRWMARLYSTHITGATRDDLALEWSFEDGAFARLKDRELGKRIVFTDRTEWSTKQIVVRLGGLGAPAPPEPQPVSVRRRRGDRPRTHKPKGHEYVNDGPYNHDRDGCPCSEIGEGPGPGNLVEKARLVGTCERCEGPDPDS